MVNYSLTEFVSTAILYFIGANLTDLEFLFIDVFLAMNFAFFFGKTHAYGGKLSKRPPMTSLLSFIPLFSLAIHMIILVIFQLIAFLMVQLQPWFTPYSSKDDENFSCYENYSVFCTSIFQYIILAIIFSRGTPYRKPIYSNYTYVLSLVITTIVCIYMTVSPAKWLTNLFQLMLPPTLSWRLTIIGLASVNFIICFIIEYFLIESILENKISPRMYKPEKSKKLYLKLKHELDMNQSWPPISKESPVLPVTQSAVNIINSAKKISYTQTSLSDCDNKSNDEKENNFHESSHGYDNLAFVSDENLYCNN